MVGWNLFNDMINRNPVEEYDYTKKSWIVESLDGTNDVLKDKNWAHTSLDYSDASTFPVFHDVLALRYFTRTCRLREQTNERFARKCAKANVLCKTANGAILEIKDLDSVFKRL